MCRLPLASADRRHIHTRASTNTNYNHPPMSKWSAHDTSPMDELGTIAENLVGKNTNTAQPSCGEVLEQIHRRLPMGKHTNHSVNSLMANAIHVQPLCGQALIQEKSLHGQAWTQGTPPSHCWGVLGYDTHPCEIAWKHNTAPYGWTYKHNTAPPYGYAFEHILAHP